MENKKLINILLKDMGELQELIAEVKIKGGFDAIEIEFLHTRAKGIMQLLQMLNGYDAHEPVQKQKPEITEHVQGKIEKEKKVVEESVEEFSAQNEKINKIEDLQEDNKKEFTESVADEVEKTEEIVKEKAQEVVRPEVSVKAEKDNNNEETASVESKGVKLEEEEKTEENQRLGDSFLKGKSINDLIEEQNNLESKLSNRPVNSIQSTIGINDRFQYIRELFEGNSEKFTETISSLDAMNNINDAVSYLQQNFKWKKNETSLKFVNLVKRRFANG